MKTQRLKTLMGAIAILIALQIPLVAQELSRAQLEKMAAAAEKQRLEQEKAAKEKASQSPAADQGTGQPSVRPSEGTAMTIPLTEPPQDLKDEDGNFELDLVDPFQRGSVRASGEEASEALSSTTLGEISDEFRILAIIIPEDESREPMALIRLQDESNPQVVKKDDLVQIKRRPQDRRSVSRMRAGTGEPTFEQSAFNALESFSFYLQIREIHPTYIEAFQKKSPNESIILR